MPQNNLSDQAPDNKFNRILHSHKNLINFQFPAQEDYDFYWPAEHFGLEKSSLFRALSLFEQEKILILHSNHVLNEAYFIEQAGMKFAAKMILQAELTENAQFYCFMSSDEAVHLQILKKYLKLSDSNFLKQNSFLQLLHQIIEELEPQKLLYLVQIILEGWGQNHYLKLSKSCLNQEFKSDLQKILKDEALHTLAGKTLLKPKSFSIEQKTDLIDKLSAYASMIRKGELSSIKIIDFSLGGLSKQTKIKFLEEIDNLKTTQKKLELLMNLAAQTGMEEIVQSVCDRNLFEPCSNHETVNF
jgi:hypothetical protein